MRGKLISWGIWMAVLMSVALLGDDSRAQVSPQPNQDQIMAGQQVKVEGLILKRDAETLTLQDGSSRTLQVALNDLTEVKEKKKNPFRRAHNYATTELMRGLKVEVEGVGDTSGKLVARKIRFTQSELGVARVVESRVQPVEGELRQANSRLSENEENARHMSGQIDELSAISNAARGGAKAAQETADAALDGLREANSRITANHAAVNSRITALDEFEVMGNVVIRFRVGSAALSSESKAALDKFAEDAKNEKGYMIEVSGFASADGSEARNIELSRKRADAVVQYLVMNHQVPLRRIVTPFGYGETLPAADNSTRTGREQNRRVEAKVLVNKGIVESGRSASGNQN